MPPDAGQGKRIDIYDLLKSPLPPASRDRPCLFTPKTLSKHLAISETTLRRWRSAGLFPQPDLATGRILRWEPETVQQWLADRKRRGTRPRRRQPAGRNKKKAGA